MFNRDKLNVEEKEKTEFVGIKMRPSLLRIILQAIKKDTHFTRSSFIRTAIREKLKEEFPKLWKTEINNNEQGVSE